MPSLTNPDENFVLRYDEPAAKWVEALPLGNGRLGAMVFGGVSRERLQLNESTLWAGGPHAYDNSNALGALAEIRKLVFAGEVPAAQALINESFMGLPAGQMPYQPVGDLVWDFGDLAAQHYARHLDLNVAESEVTFTVDGIQHVRRAFASAVDQVLVVQLSASEPGQISFDLGFESPQNHEVSVDGQTLFLQGTSGDHNGLKGQVRFSALARVLPVGGTVSASEAGLRVEQADPAPVGEAASRAWRYGCLERAALELGCRHVGTGHTASDRAETVLLNLARGSHLRGLASLRAERALAHAPGQGPRLVRPLLPFSREDTARVCRDLAIPVWEDSSNADRRYRRNRLRAEVMPVLEALHPGASRRIAAQAERLEEELTHQDQLLELALQGLALASDPSGRSLARRALGQLGPANRRRLLQHWLRRHGAQGLEGAALEDLIRRLEPEQGPGQQDLAGGWRLRWERNTMGLQAPGDQEHGDG
jgi:tRNA(Ile)-lysidine synthetase-like protein